MYAHALTHTIVGRHQILWTFSIYLEAVAFYPQLLLLQRLKEVENLTSNYVFAIGAYVSPSCSVRLGRPASPSACPQISRPVHTELDL